MCIRDRPSHVREIITGYVAGYNQVAAEAQHSGGAAAWACNCDGSPARWIEPVGEEVFYAYFADVAMMASGRNLVSLIGRAEAPGPEGPVPASPDSALGQTAPGASNGWAVGGDVTASGHGMVLGNPHFPWYGEARGFSFEEEVQPVLDRACAKCHSEGGHLDFLGADGSAAGIVDAPASVDTVVSCTVCHNPVSVSKVSVVFPSGVEITGSDASVRCMECHQGRESTVSVNQAITDSGLGLDDPSPDLRFRNIHYFAAASTLYGSEVHGSYEFEGMAYQPKFGHVPGYDSCMGCHNVHTLEVKVSECSVCHDNVASAEDLTAIRMPGSLVDYDGDGSTDEGIYDGLEGLQAMLYQAIDTSASEVAGAPILYDARAYPYWCADSNSNGQMDGDEGGYAAFTPRLLQATYNCQDYEKDPGAFAHNGKYYAQILYDSIATLNEALAQPVDLAQAHRNPPGHFDSTAEAFRHWDEDVEVPGTCTKCHTSEGLPFYLDQGVTIAFPPSTSLSCSTCHTNFEDFALFASDEVAFPSGAKLSFGEGVASNLCLNCHQGRESAVSVSKLIGDTEPDAQSESLRFINPHYFAAGATLYGREAMGMYQYEGKEYAGLNEQSGKNQCSDCHQTHALTVDPNVCAECHEEVESAEDFVNVRYNFADYDGDGDDAELRCRAHRQPEDARQPAVDLQRPHAQRRGDAEGGGDHRQQPQMFNRHWFIHECQRRAHDEEVANQRIDQHDDCSFVCSNLANRNGGNGSCEGREQRRQVPNRQGRLSGAQYDQHTDKSNNDGDPTLETNPFAKYRNR
mgnify:CR=1 FL=1